MMIEKSYANYWRAPSVDERWEGLLRLADTIYATYQYANGDIRSIQRVEPLELSAQLRKAADRIDALTKDDQSHG
jgi:hypothetical protein